MKAVVCTKYGPPEVLQIKEMEEPVPRNDEVLVRIKATTVAQADSRVRGFRVPLSYWVPARLALGLTKPKKPVLGTELAGVVEGVGKDVSNYKVGDNVFALTGHDLGCYAEYRCVPEGGIISRKPVNLGFEESAAIPMGGLTALHFLKEGKVGSGQKVLVYGASGSIGTYAVQLAKYFGAEVTGVCSTANLDLVRSLGADKVIDYTKEDFSNEGGIYDVMLDAVGKSPISASMRSLKKGGYYLQVLAPPGANLRMRWATMTKGNRMVGGTMAPGAKDLAFLKDLVEEGKIKPIIDRTYPLEQIVEAHRYVDQGHKKGNVAIRV